MLTLTQEQLDKKLKVWQRRMRLQDWTIRVSLSPKWDKGSGTTFGQCWPDRRNKQAEIKILRPEDYDPDDNIVAYDAEQTLVHELIHVQFTGTEPANKAPEAELYETAVEQMATALVNIFRRKGR